MHPSNRCEPMSWKTRLSVVSALAFLFVISGASAQSQVTCEDAGLWLKSNLERLPQTPEELVALPAVYRVAAFKALPISQRDELWHAHLDDFLAAHPELSHEDQKMVAEIDNLFKRPETFEAFSLSPRGQELLDAVGAIFSASAGEYLALGNPAQSGDYRFATFTLRKCNCTCPAPDCFTGILCLPVQGGCNGGQDDCDCYDP